MSVYSKKATKAQKKWLKEFEEATTFEALHQEDLDSGFMTFTQVAMANVRWFENWYADAMHAIPEVPEG